jgi:hypothetical protein
VLFDLGLYCLQVDVCIRTSDPGLLGRLRRQEGRGLFESTNDVMAVILAANPHRVLIGRLGRIEVFQPIPAADGPSPMGPHTHVLPKLLAQRRTHAATEPIPGGFVPCAHPLGTSAQDQGREHNCCYKKAKTLRRCYMRWSVYLLSRLMRGHPGLAALCHSGSQALETGYVGRATTVAPNESFFDFSCR